MKMIDDSAIQPTQQRTRSAAIPGHRLAGLTGHFDKILISRFHGHNTSRGCQVEAKSEIENCADDKRLAEFAAAFLLSRELQSPQRIGFPEIDA